MVRVPPVSLNSATARSPLASCLVKTTSPPDEEMMTPCLPSESWSIAMTSRLLRMSKVCWLAFRRSVPMSSGAAISAHRLKWVTCSALLRLPLPISSMSGSFQWPGPATLAWLEFALMIDSIRVQFGLMSPVVRHRLPTFGAQFHGLFLPHSQML